MLGKALAHGRSFIFIFLGVVAVSMLLYPLAGS